MCSHVIEKNFQLTRVVCRKLKKNLTSLVVEVLRSKDNNFPQSVIRNVKEMKKEEKRCDYQTESRVS